MVVGKPGEAAHLEEPFTTKTMEQWLLETDPLPGNIIRSIIIIIIIIIIIKIEAGIYSNFPCSLRHQYVSKM